MENEQLSQLIGDIYDATLDPARWTGALEDVAEFVGGCASALFMKDSVRKTQNNVTTFGYDAEFTKSYFDKYIALDPFTTGQFFSAPGGVVSLSDLMSHTEFLTTRFYREWVQPQQWIDAIAATLDKTQTSYAAVSVIRHERDGVVDDETRHRMSLIVPHVRRAVLIGKTIDLHKVEAAALADTLDGIAAAMFLADAAGRVVHANAAGHRMLSDGRVLRAPGGKLGSPDAAAERALHDILANAAGGDAGVGTRGIAVPVQSNDADAHVAHVLPLNSGERRRGGIAYSAVAAVFVQKAALGTPSAPEVIAKTYRLTPGELRVLLATVEVGGPAEVADALGVAETTVKTHLRHLFDKTGAHRQADLVKLVAGFTSPVAGSRP